MKKNVIIATDNLLLTDSAKTAHGLIRGSERFNVLGVVDSKYKNLDAGELLDGSFRNIPVVDSIDEAIKKFDNIDYLVLGVATVGGFLSNSLLDVVMDAITKHISIVNGLHEKLNEHKEVALLAKENGVELIDIRTPKSSKDLHFWKGDIYKVDVPIVAFLAMDCAMGKRTTARFVKEECLNMNMRVEMIYTGQTGWMQGNKYGFIFDSTLNEFVAGELENAIVNCWKEATPDLILLEGQSSLRNPSGPCGIEFLISGNAKQIVLINDPKKTYFDNDPIWGEIPSVASEIEIIEKFGAKVIALALNTRGLSKEEALDYQTRYKKSLGIPVVMPLEEGVTRIISEIKGLQS
ncbi:MAG: Uncharacterised protein [Flavobacterium sp. SCGC AAA160-P02]|nr:MAG: Uncharacterised protein [Flavobacterium sp. SCGC AAA160-P02]